MTEETKQEIQEDLTGKCREGIIGENARENGVVVSNELETEFRRIEKVVPAKLLGSNSGEVIRTDEPYLRGITKKTIEKFNEAITRIETDGTVSEAVAEDGKNIGGENILESLIRTLYAMTQQRMDKRSAIKCSELLLQYCGMISPEKMMKLQIEMAKAKSNRGVKINIAGSSSGVKMDVEEKSN